MMLDLLEKTAKKLIKRHEPIVICITGSVGKTSVKNAVASALSESFVVRKTPKNINSDFGVAISVIGGFEFKEGFRALLKILVYGLKQLYITDRFPEILVIEVGAGKIGEIERVSRWLKPDILVITNLPDKPSHLAIFGSKEKIIREKKFLADVMDSDGLMFIDDSEKNMDHFTKNFVGRVVKYDYRDFIDKSDYKIIYTKNKGYIMPSGIKFKIDIYGDKNNLEFKNFIGKQNIKAILISKLIAEKLDCEKTDILKGLSKYTPEPGRLKILKGKLDAVTIIDDSFNASPIAVENSLYNLISVESGVEQRKVAVLGDMLNLGDESEEIHKNTATSDIAKVDILITIGDKSRVWQNFNDDKLSLNKHFKNSTNAAKYIESVWKEGDIILFKASYLIRLEKAIKYLSTCSGEDLVRQEGYWQKPEFELYEEQDD